MNPSTTAERSAAETRVRKVLIKISGESLARPGKPGLDPAVVAEVAADIREVQELDTQVAVVVGAGNLVRGAEFARAGTGRATADQMGMLGTAINCLALQDALERASVATRAASAMEIRAFMEPYIRRRMLRHLEKGRVVILAGGTGNPYFTTDTAAALRATELGVDAILKATKVDGVYTADPAHHPEAVKIRRITFREALDRELQIMDRTAFTLCMENRMPIMVFDMFVRGNMARAVRGEDIGTWVVPAEQAPPLPPVPGCRIREET